MNKRLKKTKKKRLAQKKPPLETAQWCPKCEAPGFGVKRTVTTQPSEQWRVVRLRECRRCGHSEECFELLSSDSIKMQQKASAIDALVEGVADRLQRTPHLLQQPRLVRGGDDGNGSTNGSNGSGQKRGNGSNGSNGGASARGSRNLSNSGAARRRDRGGNRSNV